MTTLFNVTIDLAKHAADAADALAFRHGFEDAIEDYGIGKVVDAGMMIAGTSVDVSFETEDPVRARAFLEDYLTHCEVFKDTRIDTEPIQHQ